MSRRRSGERTRPRARAWGRASEVALGVAVAVATAQPAAAQEVASTEPTVTEPTVTEPAATEEAGILRQAPAQLLVVAIPGARVSVDGVVVGTTPFPRAITLDPGRHRVDVAANGFEPASRDVLVGSGRQVSVAVDLEATGQRRLAWAFVVSGAAGIAAGIGLGVVAVVEHRRAQDLPGDADEGSATPDVQSEYDAAIAARDDFRVGSGLGAGLGLGLFLVGGLLFTFDEPEGAGSGAAASPGGARWGAAPVAGPGRAGGVATVRF